MRGKCPPLTRGTEHFDSSSMSDQTHVALDTMASRPKLALLAATVASAVVIYFVHGAQETERKVRRSKRNSRPCALHGTLYALQLPRQVTLSNCR